VPTKVPTPQNFVFIYASQDILDTRTLLLSWAYSNKNIKGAGSFLNILWRKSAYGELHNRQMPFKSSGVEFEVHFQIFSQRSIVLIIVRRLTFLVR